MELKDELWWQNLEEWIFDESKLVTYKYVASSLKIHVNVAKKMLFTYSKESTRKTFAIYLVSGSINGECHVKLISDKDIEKEESQFDQILTKHVYALGQPSVSDTNDLSGMLHLSSINNAPNDILPYRGVVCDKSLQVRTNDKIKTEPESKSEEVMKKDISAPVKKTTVKEEADNAPEKKPLDKEVPTKAAKKTSAGKSNAIKSMFAKAPPKKEKPVEEISEDKTENPTQSKPDSPGKENKASQESSCPSSNKTLEAKLNKTSTNNKSSSTKRRKRIQVMSDSDSSDNEEPEEPEPVDNHHEQSPVKEEPPEEMMEILPATPAAEETKSTKSSRRTRKLINKTFVDESGFLVTKKEYASCSEEDEPAPSPPKKVQSEEKAKAPSTTASSPTKVNKKQSSIKNFFTKK